MKLTLAVLVTVALSNATLANAHERYSVHPFNSGENGIFANAYVVETAKHVVVIDGTLLVSTGAALHSQVERIGKPIAAVLITHGHPDHYNGVGAIVNDLKIPIYSTHGVKQVIEQYDTAKAQQWVPVFGAEWPTKRAFPNTVLQSGQSIVVDRVKFTVKDLGPGESHSDSYWIADDGAKRSAFIGDLVLNHVHAYMADGHGAAWLANLSNAKQALRNVAVLYPGHGEAGGLEMLEWQAGYLREYRNNVGNLAGGNLTLTDQQKQVLTERMEQFLPNKKLAFLIALGADSVASELAAAKAGR